MNRILLFFLLISVALCTRVEAQHRYKRNTHYLEAGIMLGGTQYSGDVAENDLEFNQTQFGFGGFVRYHILHEVFLKGQVYSGNISGDDKNSPTLNRRKFRFFTPILETSLVLEYAPWALEHVTKTGIHSRYISPYFFIGAGSVTATRIETEYYGPDSEEDMWIREPFPEEGVTKRTFFTMPVGFGLRVDQLERFTFGAEFGWRPVFSDKLDGVSINGNPDENDWYYFFGLTASYFINQPWKPLP
ncbi:MAG: DUF6089 family protein [Saprospiraceae bacterium]